jgi:hypothetical protein
MSNRITDSMLEARIKWLNKLTNSPETPYSNGKANIGNWHLSHAYGGVCVNRMVNENGGASAPIIGYHTTKRECFDALCAFISGIEFAQENEVTA